MKTRLFFTAALLTIALAWGSPVEARLSGPAGSVSNSVMSSLRAANRSIPQQGSMTEEVATPDLMPTSQQQNPITEQPMMEQPAPFSSENAPEGSMTTPRVIMPAAPVVPPVLERKEIRWLQNEPGRGRDFIEDRVPVSNEPVFEPLAMPVPNTEMLGTPEGEMGGR